VGAEPGTAKKVSTSPGSDDGPAYSPDGKWLAWRSQARNGFESDLFTLVVMDRATGRFVPLNWNLQVFDADGNITSSKFDLWVNEFVWSDDSDHIYFVSDDHGEAPIFEAHVSGQGIGRMGKVAGEWQDLNFHLINGMVHVIGTKVQIDRPAEIYNYNLLKIDDSVRTFTPREPYVPQPGEHIIVIGRAKPQPVQDEQLTHLNDAVLGQLELPKMDSFWFEGAADTKVEGFIIRPPGFDARKKYPVKFLMHGGPQTAWGDAWSYRWNPELMAADGYVVVMINRRGSTGYGQKFVDEVSGDWGGKAYVDLMKGLDYAEKTYPFIDKERECALGASYGGFMANWVLTHTDRFKCIVTHDGMYNPQSAFGTTEEDWFNEWEFRPLEAANSQQGTGNRKGGKAGLSATAQKRASGRDDNVVGGGEVEQTKAAYPWDYFDKSNEDDPFRKWSPMLHIKNAKTPTLVIHGQRDYRLDVSEGLQLFDSLQMLGVPSEMLYFQDEGHWVLKPKDSELWYRTVNDWCDRWTKSGKYAAQGPGSRAQGSGKSEAQ